MIRSILFDFLEMITSKAFIIRENYCQLWILYCEFCMRHKIFFHIESELRYS